MSTIKALATSMAILVFAASVTTAAKAQEVVSLPQAKAKAALMGKDCLNQGYLLSKVTKVSAMTPKEFFKYFGAKIPAGTTQIMFHGNVPNHRPGGMGLGPVSGVVAAADFKEYVGTPLCLVDPEGLD